MAALRAATIYKTAKQPGILAIPRDGKSVTWSPDQPSGAPPSLTIPVQDISNLQKTPDTAKKAMLKIFAKGSNDANAVDHTFTFTSVDSRTEIEAITDRIRKIIDDHKKGQLAAASGSGQSAAMTIANAVSGGRNNGPIWEDDDRLKADVRLQQSLMQQDALLGRTFREALSEKPDSITSLQFTQQFWASRVHLLRAHALSQHQDRGRSNVFSDIGAIGSGKTVSITSEQIHIIFEQYPLVRRVYDELVPKRYNEASFWKRFFQSQLYLNLRGMKTDDRINRKDDYIDSDQYLNAPELTGLRPTAPELHIAKFIDLEGNEENHSQRQGNKPNIEDQQSSLENAPVIRKLNALSEKLMASVRPADTDVAAPIGSTEAEYDQLRLRDLEGDPEQHRIVLNIRDQRRFFGDTQSSKKDTSNPFTTIDPAKALKLVLEDIRTAFPSPGATNPNPRPR
ncbi:putative RNA polymerase II transcription factor B subunit 1 [Cyphellophora attinorum]|uniref:Putative RNA polymerase II transcription factor B subunit 1 n=1 Tax=Cyphellophora attinorum TaxID=1664694 RepID=A0A0N1H5C0_9EURO|nr:putative RNA polymerase II transcription factor B subunit 1 [Phialophora attinorum]KPI40826.1 putative RNA polymerase II transcription factor B subunit 1 [Phialophora attinorum]